ncbi:MAG TPA: hypothetical protein VJ440_05050 [Candidatus Brocadiaceae bacterium]|nr:hypothetical protein [Candidatus Brocadiaceae bacterium]
MRKAIWDLMLDSDMNVRYWKYLTIRYYRYDKYSKIFLAIMSSGTVASWNFWSNFPLSWKVLSGCSAILAISLPFFNFQKIVESTSDLSGKWFEIKNECEYLWHKLNELDKNNSEEISQQYERIHKKQLPLICREPTLPHDVKLLRKCQQEVILSRGLSKQT